MDKGYPIDVNKEMKRYKTIEPFGADEVVETSFREGKMIQVTREMTEKERGDRWKDLRRGRSEMIVLR